MPAMPNGAGGGGSREENRRGRPNIALRVKDNPTSGKIVFLSVGEEDSRVEMGIKSKQQHGLSKELNPISLTGHKS